MPQDKPILQTLRRAIDRVDSKLHRLLVERAAIIRRVRAQKDPRGVHLRPAREIQMLAHLLDRPRGFLPSALILRVWREMISAYTLDEQPFSVVVPEALWDVARDHFGGCVPLMTVKKDQQAYRCVKKGRTMLGVVAVPAGHQQTPWWQSLAGQHSHFVFTQIPHVIGQAGRSNARHTAPAWVLGELWPEATGRDRTVAVIKTLSFKKSAKIKVLATGKNAALIVWPGWLARDDAGRDRIARAAQVAPSQVVLIGGYAMPVKG